MNKEEYPYLVIEKRNNDYAYINIALLDILHNALYNNLASLDNLLSNFSEDELRDSIIRANIVGDLDISDKRLLILLGSRRKLPLLSYDILHEFNLYDFIAENFSDGRINNILYNKIASLVSDEEKIIYKDILDNKTSSDLIIKLYELCTKDYLAFRELYFYFNNFVANNKEIGDNKRKREIVND